MTTATATRKRKPRKPDPVRLTMALGEDQWDEDMEDLLGAWRRGYTPPPRLSVSEWAEKHRILSGKSTSESGPWRNDRTPYLVEIMDRLSPHDPHEFVVFMKGSQIGGTECGNNWAGYVMHHAPGPFLYVMPNLDDAAFTSEQRIETLIEESPVLSELVSNPDNKTKGRPAGNSKLRKTFPGGILKLVGSNSSKGLRSMPARWVYMDEVDEYPDKVGNQGDPIALIQVRSRTFWPRKFFATSSPTVKGRSKIANLYEQTDKRRYFVPCPECGHYQVIDWKRITWKTDEDGQVITDSVGMACDGCGVVIGEHHKQDMLRRGEWRATTKGRTGYVGYHLSALYSPLGWYSWVEAVREFLHAKHRADTFRDYEPLKVWTNTALAETWEEEQGQKLPWLHIKKRAGGYDIGTVPERALMLCAGIDTQDDRLEAVVRGWGYGEESWLIHHGVFWGDPETAEPWDQLDEMLRRGWPHESGALLHIVSAAIDSRGHKTQAVYNYARDRHPLVIPIAGQTQPGKPAIGRPRLVDVAFGGEVVKEGVQLWPVGSDTIKSVIYGRLRLETPGPAFMHYPHGLNDEFFRQLCGERLVTKHVRGTEVQQWVQTYPRVEALDCEVYAYAAAVRAGLQHMDWEELAALVRNSSEHSSGSVDKGRKRGQDSHKKRLRKSQPKFGGRV